MLTHTMKGKLTFIPSVCRIIKHCTVEFEIRVRLGLDWWTKRRHTITPVECLYIIEDSIWLRPIFQLTLTWVNDFTFTTEPFWIRFHLLLGKMTVELLSQHLILIPYSSLNMVLHVGMGNCRHCHAPRAIPVVLNCTIKHTGYTWNALKISAYVL